MNSITIAPNKLSGSVVIPPSKSLCHRAIISASLSRGISEITNADFSDDINSTIDAMISLGAKIVKSSDKLIIDGSNTLKEDKNYVINCGSCGTTLRLLMPLALLSGTKITFTGDESITAPYFENYFDIFHKSQIEYESNNNSLPITISGGDITGVIELSHNIHSQFLSGLLFALPLFPYDSEIRLDEPIDAKCHIDLTLDILSRFGIVIQNTNYRIFRIHGNQKYTATNYRVEGDYSIAAFYLALGAIGSFTICKGLPEETRQSEKVIFDIIEKFGGKVVCEKEGIAAIPMSLNGCRINISENPEMLPVVALLGIFASGETDIEGVVRSSDFDNDISTHITDQFNLLGATIIEKPNGLLIDGSPTIIGGAASSCNNSKLAIMIALASTYSSSDIVLDNYDVVRKIYPKFWDDFTLLGGQFC